MKVIDLENGCWIAIGNFDLQLLDMASILKEIDPDLTQKVLSFYGKTVLMPRLTAWFGEKEYNYSGTTNKPSPMPTTILDIRNRIELQCKALPGFITNKPVLNSVLCNYYRDGNDSIDWHSDNEKDLGPSKENVLIASLTFGASRKFFLKNKQTKQKLSFDLGDGDLLIMGGKTQQQWLHKIPKISKKIKPRLNLTYRVRL